MRECQNDILKLTTWFADNFDITPTNTEKTCFWVSSPLLDRHYDAIGYCVEAEVDGYLIHDNGATILDLESSGCDVSQGKRKDLLHRFLGQSGVDLCETRLQIKVAFEKADVGQFCLLKCIQDLNGLALLTRSNVAQVFSNDVAQWLKESKAKFKANVTRKGKSYSHRFDFRVESEDQLAYCQVVRKFDKAAMGKLLLTATDVKGTLARESRSFGKSTELVALYDDRRSKLNDSNETILLEAGVKPLGLHRREDLEQRLHLN